MNDLLGNAAAPTFDQPLEMLRACHGRILAQCGTLAKLLQHLPAHGCDGQAQQAAQAVLRYFNSAGQYHHDDEEMDLFPQLLASSDTVAHDLVMRLIGQHHDMESAWLQLHPMLQAVAEGKSAALEEKAVAHFSLLYERHITLENAQLLPLAAQLLSSEQLSALGKKMAGRRGVAHSSP